MIGDKVIYQFGDARDNPFIFPRSELTTRIGVSLKRSVQDSNLYNGVARLNGTNKNYKSEYVIDVTFELTDDDGEFGFDINHINRSFISSPKLLFFYEETVNSKVNIYYTYADCISPLNQNIEAQEDRGTNSRIYEASFAFLSPEYYLCDNSISYFDRSAYNNNLSLYDDSSTTYDSSSIYDSGISNSIKLLSGLADEEVINGLTKDRDLMLSYNERFIKRSNNLLVADNLVVDETIVSNNVYTNITTNQLYSTTTKDNKIYIMQISQLLQGEYFILENINNNTGIKINWVNSSPSPSNMIYNSFYNKIYNQDTGEEIPYTNVSITSSGSDYLYFDAKKTITPILQPNVDNLRVFKSTSGNLTIKIELLPSYH